MAGRGDYPPSGFGSKLREVRERIGMTQTRLADLTGAHANTVARIERGEQEPAWPLVQAFCRALGVDCTAFDAAEGAPAGGPRPDPPPPRSPGRPKKAPPSGGRGAAGRPRP